MIQNNKVIESDGRTEDQALETSLDPKVHSQHLQHQLAELIEHLRLDGSLLADPRFGALLETSAEVLTGLKAAFNHFDEEKERAWKR